VAARRTACAASGVARAETLRVGLEHRSAYTIVDFLRSADVLGPDSAAAAGAASPVPEATPSFVGIDALARSFGIGPARASVEIDEDRAHLKMLAQRMDAAAQRALLYSKPGRHTPPVVLSSLLVDDAAFVQRFELTTEAGEESVLTLRFALEERLSPNFKCATIIEQWVVQSVSGEAADSELPGRPVRG
jgi:hypothetical protein